MNEPDERPEAAAILKKLVADRYFPSVKTGEKLELINKTLAALAEIIEREVIGKDEPVEHINSRTMDGYADTRRNQLRATQRIALRRVLGGGEIQ